MALSPEKRLELSEKIQTLFDSDEDVKEWTLIGKLPFDIVDITVEAMTAKKETKMALPGSAPNEYQRLAELIQREFFPNAPPLERGGFMKAMAGGPVPAWMVRAQVADQIIEVSRSRGNEVIRPAPFEENIDEK